MGSLSEDMNEFEKIGLENGATSGYHNREREPEKLEGWPAVFALFPPEYQESSFSSPWLPNLLPAAVELAKEEIRKGSSFCFDGAAGSGKTTLAVALFRYWTSFTKYRMVYGPKKDSNPKACFVPARKISLEIKRNPTKFSRALQLAEEADFLIFDDLGAESIEDKLEIENLIEQRWWGRKKGQITIVTCAIPFDQIGIRYGGGISRRLRDFFRREIGAPPKKMNPPA